MADVSIRQHIRWPPEPASEPTSTMVLTSPGRYFVDVRILEGERRDLDWAFAGTSSSSNEEPGVRLARWAHWVDSRTAAAETVRDEGRVREGAEGASLETGRMVNPAAGVEADYEEVWREAAAEEGASVPRCVVLRRWDDERGERGMAIRVGRFAQGILRTGEGEGDVTVERWEREGGEWKRTARFGKASLPVSTLLEGDRVCEGERVQDGEREWTVVEGG